MEQGAAPAGEVTQASHSGGPGTPPSGHYEPGARSSLDGTAHKAAPGSAAPGTEKPQMERREASVPEHKGRAAPHPRGKNGAPAGAPFPSPP